MQTQANREPVPIQSACCRENLREQVLSKDCQTKFDCDSSYKFASAAFPPRMKFQPTYDSIGSQFRRRRRDVYGWIVWAADVPRSD